MHGKIAFPFLCCIRFPRCMPDAYHIWNVRLWVVGQGTVFLVYNTFQSGLKLSQYFLYLINGITGLWPFIFSELFSLFFCCFFLHVINKIWSYLFLLLCQFPTLMVTFLESRSSPERFPSFFESVSWNQGLLKSDVLKSHFAAGSSV